MVTEAETLTSTSIIINSPIWIMYASSYSSRAITFTFGQIPLGKV